MQGSMRVTDFSMRHTIESAQPLAFFGDEKGDGNGVAYPYKNGIVEAEQRGDVLSYSGYGGIRAAELRGEVRRRLGLDDDLASIYKYIATDPFIRAAIGRYRGLRITRNDPWEATLCFVISQFNNVKRIRMIVRKLVAAYGAEHVVHSGEVAFRFRSFPRPEALAEMRVDELMRHGTGFRAKYIRSVAREWRDEKGFARLASRDYADAKEELMALDGVGDKVADCILLFGYGRLDAFPVDTWIKRIVEHVYFNGRRRNVREVHEFAEERWGEHAGYAQQYLFHAGRLGKTGKARVDARQRYQG